MRKVWMYYETDGDAGYYHIRLFSSKTRADAYKKQVSSAYGEVDEIAVNQ